MKQQKEKVLYPKAGKPSTKPGHDSGKRRTTIVKPPAPKK